MSYGNKNKYDANGTMIFFSPRSKDRDKKKVSPYFAISRIVDGKIKQTDETATEVGGKLFKISLKNRVYEGVENKEATLYLKDDKANEVAGYKGYSSEIYLTSSGDIGKDDLSRIMKSWIGSVGHKNTIIQRGDYSNAHWKNMGIAILNNHVCAWFGE